jgi:hypothetical protein
MWIVFREKVFWMVRRFPSIITLERKSWMAPMTPTAIKISDSPPNNNVPPKSRAGAIYAIKAGNNATGQYSMINTNHFFDTLNVHFSVEKKAFILMSELPSLGHSKAKPK